MKAFIDKSMLLYCFLFFWVSFQWNSNIFWSLKKNQYSSSSGITMTSCPLWGVISCSLELSTIGCNSIATLLAFECRLLLAFSLPISWKIHLWEKFNVLLHFEKFGCATHSHRATLAFQRPTAYLPFFFPFYITFCHESCLSHCRLHPIFLSAGVYPDYRLQTSKFLRSSFTGLFGWRALQRSWRK